MRNLSGNRRFFGVSLIAVVFLALVAVFIIYRETPREEPGFVTEEDFLQGNGEVNGISEEGDDESEIGPVVSFDCEYAGVFRVVSSVIPYVPYAFGGDVTTSIEITFSHPLGVDFSEVFHIFPIIRGTFSQDGNTHIFTPAHAYVSNIRYTVTICARTMCRCGSYLQDYYIVSFNGRGPTELRVEHPVYETFLPDTEVFMRMSWAARGELFCVTVYDLGSAENFLRFNPNTDAPGEPFAFFPQMAPTAVGSSDYLFFGKTFPVGHYVAVLRLYGDARGRTAYKFIQVSPLSVFSFSIPGEMVVWVNCTITGNPAKGAAVTASGHTVFADSDGIARLTTGRVANAPIFIEHGGSVFAYSEQLFAPLQGPGGRFFAHLHTDPTVRTDGLMDVFGVVVPRTNHEISPDDVFAIRIGEYAEFPITLCEYGSFLAQFPVDGINGFLEVVLLVNGENLVSRWVTFVDCSELELVFRGSFDRRGYFCGETAVLSVSVQAFDGTSLEGLELTYTEGGRVILEANEQGQAGAEIETTARAIGSWQEPRWASFFLWSEGYGTAQFDKIVFPSSFFLEYKYDGGSTAVVRASYVDLGRLESAHLVPFGEISPDLFRGAPADVDFTVVVRRHTARITGDERIFDPINLQMVPNYSFNIINEQYKRIDGRTVNGVATVSGLPYSTDDFVRYSISVRFFYGSPTREFSIDLKNNEWYQFQGPPTTRYFYLEVDSTSLAPNEIVTARIMELYDRHIDTNWWIHEPRKEVLGGRMIAILFGDDGILHVAAGESTGLPLYFTEPAISNPLVTGGYFDGRLIRGIETAQVLEFDYRCRELNVGISIVRETAPGEVNLGIFVTDSNGHPVSANVAVRVYDDSMIAVVRQEPSLRMREIIRITGGTEVFRELSFVQELYRNRGLHPNWRPFVSLAWHNFGGEFAGCGGGGWPWWEEPTSERRYVVDSVAFEQVRVGEDGHGWLRLELPDNGATWRIEAFAVARDGLVGDAAGGFVLR